MANVVDNLFYAAHLIASERDWQGWRRSRRASSHAHAPRTASAPIVIRSSSRRSALVCRFGGVDYLVAMKRSGVDAGRRALKQCLEFLRDGDAPIGDQDRPPATLWRAHWGSGKKKKPWPGGNGGFFGSFGGERVARNSPHANLLAASCDQFKSYFLMIVHKENLCRRVENEKAAKAYGDSGRRPAVRLVDCVQ